MPVSEIDIASALLLIIGAYAATNFDNLLVLGTITAAHPQRRSVISGFLLASVLVLVVCLCFTAFTLILPVGALGYLGVLPIVLGMRVLLQSVPETDQAAVAAPSTWAIAVLLLSNSVDTMLVFGPLIAESEPGVIIVIVAGFVVAVGAWLGLILKLSRRLRRFGKPGRVMHYLPGLIMVGIGVYILLDTGTDLQ